jgi:hypothetical protein
MAHQSHTDCCEITVVPPLPRGESVDVAGVPDSPLVAVLAAPMFDARLVIRPRIASYEGWRAPPHSGGAERAKLMVFLT